MSKLSITQCQILKAAASRSGGAILPLTDGINLKGGALTRQPRQARSGGRER